MPSMWRYLCPTVLSLMSMFRIAVRKCISLGQALLRMRDLLLSKMHRLNRKRHIAFSNISTLGFLPDLKNKQPDHKIKLPQNASLLIYEDLNVI